MTKAKTTGKKFTLEDMKLFQAEEKDKLETLRQTGVIVEDVLSSLDFIETLKDKGLDKSFKTVKKEALKVQGALPVLIAFQNAFVKTCGAVIDEVSPRAKSRPSSKASRATTTKTTKKSTTKKQTKGRAK